MANDFQLLPQVI